MCNMKNKVVYVFLIIYIFCVHHSLAQPFGEDADNQNRQWNGNWFPHADGTPDTNEVVDFQNTEDELHDSKHGVKMGIPSKHCDTGRMDLEQDWFDEPGNYTCYYDRKLFLPRSSVYPLLIPDHIPPHYSAQHKCMKSKIYYDTDIPTFGPHRPLWAKYGEYKFLPKQRWLHNLEHGAIALLYHPCANREEVNVLRELVTNCLYRHVITPYDLLPPERPIALLAWGRRLLMSKVDPSLVQRFIMSSAKHGPEKVSKDGQYDHGLIRHANIVTNKHDDVLCPGYSDLQTME